MIGRKNYYGAQAEGAARLTPAAAMVLDDHRHRQTRRPRTPGSLTDYLTACAQAGGKPSR
jgi:hypothetical protein